MPLFKGRDRKVGHDGDSLDPAKLHKNKKNSNKSKDSFPFGRGQGLIRRGQNRKDDKN